MLDKKKTVMSIVEVAFSNIATIIAGVIIGFIIPKVLSIEGYGFCKTFTLYVSYAGMFSIGIIDGIVLDYGGHDYSQFERPFFRSIFKWYVLIHFFWAIIICIFTIIALDKNYAFLLYMIAVYMIFANIVGYFQQISQITQRFKEYAYSNLIQSVMKVACGLIMIAIYRITKDSVDYRLYVILTTSGFIAVTCGYMIIYREIIFGNAFKLQSTLHDIIHFSKIGFPLLFANLCAILLLTLDRQFVNILFTNSEYAIYAFAYNLLSLVTVATLAISTVLYPVLKRTTEETLRENYSDLISIILVFVYGALIAYFPLCAFIRWFLPKYTGSLLIFRVIFPGLAMSSAITVIMHNYYKTLGDNVTYFKKSVLILILSAVANAVAYLLFKSTISISVASIITMIIWYLYTEQYFVKHYKYERWKNLSFLLVMMGCFYSITAISNWIIAGILYLICYICVSLLLERPVLAKAKDIISKRSNNKE